MKNWWLTLSSSERSMLLVSAILMMAFLFYMFIWSPFSEKVFQLQTDVHNNQLLLRWMEQRVPELEKLKHAQVKSNEIKTVKKENISLLTLLEQTLKNGSLAYLTPTLKQTIKKQVKVDFKEVPFNNLILWLYKLKDKYAVDVLQINMHATDKAGYIKTDILLGMP